MNSLSRALHALVPLIALSAACGNSTSSSDASVTDTSHSETSTVSSSDAASSQASSASADASDASGGDAATDSTQVVDAKHTGAWKIMPLGDSITGTTCYPQLLSKDLIDNSHTNFTFIGLNPNNQGCNGAPVVYTEGHGGYLVTNLTSETNTGLGSYSELLTWAAEKPDVVLMQIGTNDAWSSKPTASISSAYTAVLTEFRAQNPNVIFFVAQITPLNPSGCSNCEANVEALNAAIPAWAAGKSTAASPVLVVNVFSKFDPSTYTVNSTYTSDGCHPNVAGSQLIADAWYTALTAQGLP